MPELNPVGRVWGLTHCAALADFIPDDAGHLARVVIEPIERIAFDQVQVAVAIAVEASGLRRTIVYPNSDRGHTGVLRAIEAHCASSPTDGARAVRSLPRAEYLQALIDADVLVGNSSSGIIEAATAGTAVVNVGRRQHGRETAHKPSLTVGARLPR